MKYVADNTDNPIRPLGPEHPMLHPQLGSNLLKVAQAYFTAKPEDKTKALSEALQQIREQRQ